MTKKEKFTLRLSVLDEHEKCLEVMEEDFQNKENADELFRQLRLLWNNYEYFVWTDEEEEI